MNWSFYTKCCQSISCRLFALVCMLSVSSSLFAHTGKRSSVEAETATIVGNASKVNDPAASGKQAVMLTKAGDGLLFMGVSTARKLGIRYASVSVGTITVIINKEKDVKINIHSSGATAGSFIHAVTDISIPAGASLKLLIDSSIAVSIDKIITGDDDLGLAPDIWNLPALPVAKGSYPADWEGMSRLYVTPEWWRDAKFGAWAHWDPQSMPEKGDWYARKMYLERDPVYAFHTKTYMDILQSMDTKT